MKKPTASRKSWRWPLVAAFVAALALSVLIGGAIAAANGGVNLFNPLSAQPAAKAGAMSQNLSAEATAQALHPVKPTARPNEGQPVVVGPTPTLTSGIFSVFGAPVSNSTFSSGSMYRGWVGAQFEYVYAGAGWISFANNQSRGEILVYVDGASTPPGIYDVSDGASSLRIISAAGDTLTLKTNTGATITFNLLTNTFGY